jgi:hypothetical protein
MTDIRNIINGWQTGELWPHKGALIGAENHVNSMDAHGQILHFVGGWSFKRLRNEDEADTYQTIDKAVAKLLNISRAHSMLLRHINYGEHFDSYYYYHYVDYNHEEDLPAVFTAPGVILGKQWSKILDFWWLLDSCTAEDWAHIEKIRDDCGWAAQKEAECFVWDAAIRACGEVAARWAKDATWGFIRDMQDNDEEVPSGIAENAVLEIQGYDVFAQQSCKPFFLPMFGIKTLDDIPPRPASYGNGVVPSGEET